MENNITYKTEQEKKYYSNFQAAQTALKKDPVYFIKYLNWYHPYITKEQRNMLNKRWKNLVDKYMNNHQLTEGKEIL